MKKKGFLVFLLALVLSVASINAAETNQTVEFPNITLFDDAGKAIDLTSFKGKPVVLNFWASWCGPCKSEMPDFDEVYKELGDEVHFVMVNMTDGVRETVEKAKDYIKAQGYSFPVYYDTAQSAAYTLGISSIPTTFFLNAKGHGVAYAVGAMGKDSILYGIEMAKSN